MFNLTFSQLCGVLFIIGRNYTMFMSYAPPQTLRYSLLTAQSNAAISIGLWYPQSNRRDVYVDGDFVMPQNGRWGFNNKYLLDNPTFPGQFVPDLSQDESGANYFDRNTNILYVIIKENQKVQIVTTESIIVSFLFPPLTADEFFGENLVHNLAAFFDVSPDKVRVVNIVRETSRKRRSASNTTSTEKSVSVDFEIADSPAERKLYS